eukprot:jgi/Mesen1/10853/ME000093S10372
MKQVPAPFLAEPGRAGSGSGARPAHARGPSDLLLSWWGAGAASAGPASEGLGGSALGGAEEKGGGISRNTVKATRTAELCFRGWARDVLRECEPGCPEKGVSLSHWRDPREAAHKVEQWVLQVRQANGKPFAPRSLHCLFSGLQRAYNQAEEEMAQRRGRKPRVWSFLRDPEFARAKRALRARMSELVGQQGGGLLPAAAAAAAADSTDDNNRAAPPPLAILPAAPPPLGRDNFDAILESGCLWGGDTVSFTLLKLFVFAGFGAGHGALGHAAIRWRGFSVLDRDLPTMRVEYDPARAAAAGAVGGAGENGAEEAEEAEVAEEAESEKEREYGPQEALVFMAKPPAFAAICPVRVLEQEARMRPAHAPDYFYLAALPSDPLHETRFSSVRLAAGDLEEFAYTLATQAGLQEFASGADGGHAFLQALGVGTMHLSGAAGADGSSGPGTGGGQSPTGHTTAGTTGRGQHARAAASAAAPAAESGVAAAPPQGNDTEFQGEHHHQQQQQQHQQQQGLAVAGDGGARADASPGAPSHSPAAPPSAAAAAAATDAAAEGQDAAGVLGDALGPHSAARGSSADEMHQINGSSGAGGGGAGGGALFEPDDGRYAEYGVGAAAHQLRHRQQQQHGGGGADSRGTDHHHAHGRPGMDVDMGGGATEDYDEEMGDAELDGEELEEGGGTPEGHRRRRIVCWCVCVCMCVCMCVLRCWTGAGAAGGQREEEEAARRELRKPDTWSFLKDPEFAGAKQALRRRLLELQANEPTARQQQRGGGGAGGGGSDGRKAAKRLPPPQAQRGSGGGGGGHGALPYSSAHSRGGGGARRLRYALQQQQQQQQPAPMAVPVFLQMAPPGHMLPPGHYLTGVPPAHHHHHHEYVQAGHHLPPPPPPPGYVTAEHPPPPFAYHLPAGYLPAPPPHEAPAAVGYYPGLPHHAAAAAAAAAVGSGDAEEYMAAAEGEQAEGQREGEVESERDGHAPPPLLLEGGSNHQLPGAVAVAPESVLAEGQPDRSHDDELLAAGGGGGEVQVLERSATPAAPQMIPHSHSLAQSQAVPAPAPGPDSGPGSISATDADARLQAEGGTGSQGGEEQQLPEQHEQQQQQEEHADGTQGGAAAAAAAAADADREHQQQAQQQEGASLPDDDDGSHAQVVDEDAAAQAEPQQQLTAAAAGAAEGQEDAVPLSVDEKEHPGAANHQAGAPRDEAGLHHAFMLPAASPQPFHSTFAPHAPPPPAASAAASAAAAAAPAAAGGAAAAAALPPHPPAPPQEGKPPVTIMSSYMPASMPGTPGVMYASPAEGGGGAGGVAGAAGPQRRGLQAHWCRACKGSKALRAKCGTRQAVAQCEYRPPPDRGGRPKRKAADEFDDAALDEEDWEDKDAPEEADAPWHRVGKGTSQLAVHEPGPPPRGQHVFYGNTPVYMSAPPSSAPPSAHHHHPYGSHAAPVPAPQYYYYAVQPWAQPGPPPHPDPNLGQPALHPMPGAHVAPSEKAAGVAQPGHGPGAPQLYAATAPPAMYHPVFMQPYYASAPPPHAAAGATAAAHAPAAPERAAAGAPTRAPIRDHAQAPLTAARIAHAQHPLAGAAVGSPPPLSSAYPSVGTFGSDHHEVGHTPATPAGTQSSHYPGGATPLSEPPPLQAEASGGDLGTGTEAHVQLQEGEVGLLLPVEQSKADADIFDGPGVHDVRGEAPQQLGGGADEPVPGGMCVEPGAAAHIASPPPLGVAGVPDEVAQSEQGAFN